MRGLRGCFDRLIDYPEIAPIYPGVRPQMRVFHYRSHCIFYRVEGERIIVVRVLHARRDPRDLL